MYTGYFIDRFIVTRPSVFRVQTQIGFLVCRDPESKERKFYLYNSGRDQL